MDKAFLAAAAGCLPPGRRRCGRLPEPVQAAVQEIRLRAGGPLTLSTPLHEYALTPDGRALERPSAQALCCTAAQLNDCFQALCEYSVHTHQQELRHGYISTRSGCRVGVAGTAVVEDGAVVSVRTLTSLCIRVARSHNGCADELKRLLDRDGLRGMLICGEPSSGKSSLLRDLARQLADDGRRVAVVDERGELSGHLPLPRCDVLKGYPKPEGIQQAVRCLAPDVVIFDELGTGEETDAVCAGLNAGVTAIASAHGRDIPSLLRREPVHRALRSGAFEQVVLLAGRQQPGRIAGIREAGECLHEMDRFAADGAGGDRAGRICRAATVPPRRLA